MARYLATVAPGLEAVAASELEAKLPQAMLEPPLRGRLIVETERPWQDLLALRTVDNLYLHLARWPVGLHKADLASLRKAARRLAVPFDLLLTDNAPRRRKAIEFVVHASRTGRHTYSRFEAAEAVAAGLAAADRRLVRARPLPGRPAQLEFRLDVLSDVAHLSARLTPPSFRFRGERRFVRGALRPSVAHGLVWLSGPRPEQRFLDPCCGSGTILTERIAYPARAVWGGDIDKEAVAAARANAEQAIGGRAAPPYRVAEWDAGALPLDPGSIDVVVSNLPFGRQIGDPGSVEALYRRLAAELARVLSPKGAAWLLTERPAVLQTACAEAGLAAVVVGTLSLRGLTPAIVRTGREAGAPPQTPNPRVEAASREGAISCTPARERSPLPRRSSSEPVPSSSPSLS
ncbi:MAG TPA: methyltransferase domain-containing protein [Limnochordia bacterium]